MLLCLQAFVFRGWEGAQSPTGTVALPKPQTVRSMLYPVSSSQRTSQRFHDQYDKYPLAFHASSAIITMSFAGCWSSASPIPPTPMRASRCWILTMNKG